MYKGKDKQKKKAEAAKVAAAKAATKAASKTGSTSSVASMLGALYLAGKTVATTAQSVASTAANYVAPVVNATVNVTADAVTGAVVGTLTGNVGRYPAPDKPRVCYNETEGAAPNQVVPCEPTPCETGCVTGLTLAGTLLFAGVSVLFYKAGVFSKVKEKCCPTTAPTEGTELVVNTRTSYDAV